MNIDYNDLNVYKNSINRVICYPAFTSTSSDLYGFNYGFNTLLIINSNYSKSVVSIENFSKFKKEKEYLFLPFSFFKIVNVKINEGTKQNPHIINLIAINSEKPIEEMFLNFVKNFSDSLDPEGLDILKLFGDKIIFNSGINILGSIPDYATMIRYANDTLAGCPDADFSFRTENSGKRFISAINTELLAFKNK